MPAKPTEPIERRQTRVAAVWFWFRVTCFRIRRLTYNLGSSSKRLKADSQLKSIWPVRGRSRSLLYSSNLASDFTLQAGKVQNLRCALKSMRCVSVELGTTFSFWAQVGRPTRSRGYVFGRELREGCIIPSVGGGLCQLSNALYDAALQAGLEIVERHAHTQRVPGSMAESGRDATVFWNYVDLRLRATFPWQIEVTIQGGELMVEIRAEKLVVSKQVTPAPTIQDHGAESCESCGMVKCFRHEEMQHLATQGRTAWLVDAWWPEHDTWMQEQRQANDWLLMPMRCQRYPWKTASWSHVISFPWFVFKRSRKSRRLASQGAARQQALLFADETLARLYEKSLPFDALHLVVSQNLLPFLYQSGALAGRTYDVLMQRWPLTELQRQLDLAAQVHSQSETLADFRAPLSLIQAETDALAGAARWITPHRGVAALAGKKAVLLDWKLPKPSKANRMSSDKSQIIFPATTLGRKGAWEIREVARALDLRVVLGGGVLESPSFWEGLQIIEAGPTWNEYPSLVVLPAWIENQPRRLLQVLADGRRVIASEACGLAGQSGVITIPTGSVDDLIKAIKAEIEV